MARDEFAIRREAASCENGCFRFRVEVKGCAGANKHEDAGRVVRL